MNNSDPVGRNATVVISSTWIQMPYAEFGFYALVIGLRKVLFILEIYMCIGRLRNGSTNGRNVGTEKRHDLCSTSWDKQSSDLLRLTESHQPCEFEGSTS